MPKLDPFHEKRFVRIMKAVQVQEVQFEPKMFPNEALPTSSGYLPISSCSSSRLFYVYYEASDSESNISETPLMLWLNGGPGCSSLIGCFYEIGPWIVKEDRTLHRNSGAWNRRCGILFIDSPIGTGYSVVSAEADIPRSSETVAAHLYNGLKYFISQNLNFEKRPLFLAGESYAGKYLPALAQHIMKAQNGANGLATQLSGIVIGNGLTDPRTQVQLHSDVCYCFGLLDKQQSEFIGNLSRHIVELIDREEWLEAHEKRTYLCNWIESTSGVATLLDIRRASKYHKLPDGTDYLAEFLNLPYVRMLLKVDRSALNFVSCRQSIRNAMAEDTMKSAKGMMEEILKKKIPVLLYQGQYDAKDGPPSSEAWMRALKWEELDAFWRSNRDIWKVKGQVAGHWRRYKYLTHVINAGAGHQVPADVPLFAQAMIEQWLKSALYSRNKRRSVSRL